MKNIIDWDNMVFVFYKENLLRPTHKYETNVTRFSNYIYNYRKRNGVHKAVWTLSILKQADNYLSVLTCTVVFL